MGVQKERNIALVLIWPLLFVAQVWKLPANLTVARKGEAMLLKRVGAGDDALEVLQGRG